MALLQCGAVAVVLAALPYKLFDLDRFFIPKELVLHLVAAGTALLCLGRARRLTLTRVDSFLAGYLALSVVSALVAANAWLALRAVAVTLAGVALFWVARSLGRAGLARPLLTALALAVVIGTLTSLLQAYGVRTELFSLNRSPGGTFGNRNFMAHLAAIGLPVLLLCALVTGWVAAHLPPLWRDRRIGRRLTTVGLSAGLGVALALVLPNTLDWRSDSPYLDTVTGVVNYKEGSGRGRLVQYSNTLRMALGHPLLGVGPGNWPVEYPRFAPRTDASLNRDDGMTANPWPSSDWMAFLAERGVPAFLLLALAMAGLAIGAWRQMGDAGRPAELLRALALSAALLVTAVVGSLDAVLLLPAPTLIVWSLLGALAPPSPPRATVALSDRTRRWALAAVAAGGTLFVTRNALQIVAMSAFSSGGRLAALEHASLADPGSYRIHLRLAQAYVRRGSCERVRAHAGAARGLFPSAREPRQLLARCGGAATGATSSPFVRAAR